MSKKYSITEARSNLPKIVDQAEAGTEVELTRRGKPVAVIISHRQMERLRSERPRFADVYKAFLRRHSLKDVGVEDDFLQAAREKGTGRKVSFVILRYLLDTSIVSSPISRKPTRRS